jgi:hypothetical protein
VARHAVKRIVSWRRIPVPLAWMAEARYRADSLEPVWPLLTELAWLLPDRFAALSQRLPDVSLDGLRGKFDSNFEGSGQMADLAWFPAWVLLDKPGLATFCVKRSM